MKTENWKKVRLGDFVKIRTGKLDANASSDDGKYPFFTCSIEPLKISTYSYDCECVLVAGNGDLNVKYYNGKFDAYQRTYIIESLNKNILDVKFLYTFLSLYIETLRKLSIGGVIKYIKLANLTEALIPLPSLEIQKKISKTIKKSEKIIEENKQLLEKYDTLIKSRFIEMFGDNPIENGKWKVEKLGNLGLCKNGMNFSYEDNGFEINCLGVGDFKDNAVISNCEKLPVISLNEKPSEEYLLKDNDIVFVRSNGNKELVGRSVLVHPRVLTTFSGFCIRFRLSTDSINHLFLLQFLKMPNTRKNMAVRGANIQNLNQQILSNLDIPVPPIELQNDFASFVQQIDKSKFAVQKSLEKTETLYKSLMQRYFA